MRKSLIAQSVAALIGGLGVAAVANAAIWAPDGVGSVPTGTGPAATRLVVNTDQIGHINLVPYFSAAGGNDTYINITNTDVVNGKAVKVRFRGASNSDDVYDITVLMSPGDVWAAAISKDAATGLPKLTHNDKSCTLPGNVQGTFVTSRLDPDATAAEKAAQASEGYVEILNMADIPVNTASGSLYNAIKHVNGVAPCTALALNRLGADSTSYADARSKGLEVPTTGLMTNWTIINVPKAASYTGGAVSLEARDDTGARGYGNIVLFPQTNAAPTQDVNFLTSDPLMRDLNVTGGSSDYPIITAASFDFPDLSTPYVVGDVLDADAPLEQAALLTEALAVLSTTNEFVTDPGILGKTNWVFSMPTRRYSVAFDYSADEGDEATFSDLPLVFFNSTNITVSGRQLCVGGIETVSKDAVSLETRFRIGYTGDREERAATAPTDFVISPGEPDAPLTFCGEVSVIGFNGTNPLGASITMKDITGSFVDGWMRINTDGLSENGLPIIGNMMTELFNGQATAGTAGAYGQTFPHRHTRAVPVGLPD